MLRRLGRRRRRGRAGPRHGAGYVRPRRGEPVEQRRRLAAAPRHRGRALAPRCARAQPRAPRQDHHGAGQRRAAAPRAASRTGPVGCPARADKGRGAWSRLAPRAGFISSRLARTGQPDQLKRSRTQPNRVDFAFSKRPSLRILRLTGSFRLSPSRGRGGSPSRRPKIAGLG